MSGYVPLPGSKRSLMPNSRRAGPVDRSEIDSLTFRVRSAGKLKDLEKRVYAESKKPLAKRTHLSRSQLAEMYGASASDLDKVEQYAHEHDLMVVDRSAAERSIVLKGTVGDLLNAFPASVSVYHHSTGTYRGRQGEISIPKELEGIVTGVFGYDTRPRHRSPHQAETQDRVLEHSRYRCRGRRAATASAANPPTRPRTATARWTTC